MPEDAGGVRPNRGMAIPVVLFIVSIGMIVMFSLAFHSESNISDSRTTYLKVKAEFLAESAINVLFLKMSEMKQDLFDISDDKPKLKRFIHELHNRDIKLSRDGFYKVDDFDIIQQDKGNLVIKVNATGKVEKISRSISKILKIRIQ